MPGLIDSTFSTFSSASSLGSKAYTPSTDVNALLAIIAMENGSGAPPTDFTVLPTYNGTTMLEVGNLHNNHGLRMGIYAVEVSSPGVAATIDFEWAVGVTHSVELLAWSSVDFSTLIDIASTASSDQSSDGIADNLITTGLSTDDGVYLAAMFHANQVVTWPTGYTPVTSFGGFIGYESAYELSSLAALQVSNDVDFITARRYIVAQIGIPALQASAPSPPTGLVVTASTPNEIDAAFTVVDVDAIHVLEGWPTTVTASTWVQIGQFSTNVSSGLFPGLAAGDWDFRLFALDPATSVASTAIFSTGITVTAAAEGIWPLLYQYLYR